MPSGEVEENALDSSVRSVEEHAPDVSERPLASQLKRSLTISWSSGSSTSISGNRSSKGTCAICLSTIKAGHGEAIFTAECSHTFHFLCISSNVKHGNHKCPICRMKWKQVPFRGPQTHDQYQDTTRVSSTNWPHNGSHSSVTQLPYVRSINRQRYNAPFLNSSEPRVFDDDEPLNLQLESSELLMHGCTNKVHVKTYMDYSAIPRSASKGNFDILIHLKAPASSIVSQTSRAPIDLVTVLDVSASMDGTKLALLKRAMGFVIQNLGPSDRLSIICFSSTACRLFGLRCMSLSGKRHALQAVNSLMAEGGTNIVDGLKKAVKVIEERKEKSPVCSIILLSDGQDNYYVSQSFGGILDYTHPNYQSPTFWDVISHQLPVHAFGFGEDHDAVILHSISETSGGTFSFIETESVLQDAFAQCIGGLLSVVVQNMTIFVDCRHPGVHFNEIKSGNYESRVAPDMRSGSINVGHLYANEERNFMLSINVPPAQDCTLLLEVGCSYEDAVSKREIYLDYIKVQLQRLEFVEEQTMSMEVDRQRNRLYVAEALSDAKVAAEQGALSEAVIILENCRLMIGESLSARSGDKMCMALDAELKEMQERMTSMHRYYTSGRAYMLSGLSSHLWQRATARGDSTDLSTTIHAYQTPSMVEMLSRSQVLSMSPQLPVSEVQPSKHTLQQSASK
ncbi:hypothetical protein J5N97_024531 [Dioscorea zingiberensis]|uniref:Uncharacterized protein n=1 Tax=Dioscorea zingiberensis TaxID=325984 RepID=A0A9D5C770_9LILI|nr:hypothetical protein J5N97_024531 [Dioscorea zingiberensis]